MTLEEAHLILNVKKDQPLDVVQKVNSNLLVQSLLIKEESVDRIELEEGQS